MKTTCKYERQTDRQAHTRTHATQPHTHTHWVHICSCKWMFGTWNQQV